VSTEEFQPTFVPIAIVGSGVLVPGATDIDGFWRNVVSGQDLLTDVPRSHWLIDDHYDPDPDAPDKTYGRRGAFLPPIEFDPLIFGITPNSLESTDTSQLLALLVADQTLRDASGGDWSRVDRERTGVIIGTSALELLSTMSHRQQRPTWHRAMLDLGLDERTAHMICDRIADQYVPWQETTFPGLLSNVVAGRIANRFDLHGTNYTTDAACASSMAAILGAVSQLALGQADMMITGGVDTLNDITMYMCFSKTTALSPTGDCRPFAADADGTMLGEGLVMFALKRLADAERDGDQVYAVIRGIGSSSDGRATSVYAPLAQGQARAVRAAYRLAGYGPDTVELVEAHGTGTRAGDAAEFAALRTVFAESGRTGPPWCAVGSVKSQIGHTKSAAGAVGLLKAVLALRHKVLPPTIKVDQPNPALELAGSPLYLNTKPRPWVRDTSHPRRASVSSFGFGGTNFHVALEEHTSIAPPPVRLAATELVLFSGRTSAELAVALADVTDNPGPLDELARDSQRREHHLAPVRLAIVATDLADLAEKARLVRGILATSTERRFTAAGVVLDLDAPSVGRTAFLFPGQGSQYPGMGADLALELPVARAAWDRAAANLFDGMRLHEVVFPVPAFDADEIADQERMLTRTEWAQPAIAVHCLALTDTLRAFGVTPDVVAGHSFGELVALHAAGAWDAPTLVRLARLRGELMRDATTGGGMLAVSASAEEVTSALRGDGPARTWIANHNAPRQVVLSGSDEALAEAADALRGAGLSTRRLNTATAFHSPIVAAAGRAFGERVERMDVAAPRIPVYRNTDASTYPADPTAVGGALAAHLVEPVRFVDMVRAMYDDGVRTFVEVGPGATLTSLVGQILRDRGAHVAVATDSRNQHGVTALQEALGALVVAGHRVDFKPLDNARPATPPTAAGSAATVTISGANLGRRHSASRDVPAVEKTAGRTVEPRPEVTGTGSSPAHQNRLAHQGGPAHQNGFVHENGFVQQEGAVVVSDLGQIQQQSAQAHMAYQQAMTDAHLAFLRFAETTVLALTGSAGQVTSNGHTPVPAPISRLAAAPAARHPLPSVPSTPQTPAAFVAPSPPAPAPLAPPTTRPAAPPDVDWESLVLEVVADRTGYPVDALVPDMELESDLGIDSIKRIEIVSGVRARVGALGDVDVAELGRLRSLSDVIARLRELGVGLEPEPPPEVTADETTRHTTAQTLTRHVVRAIPATAPGFATPGLRGATLYVTDDGGGIAAHVAAKLLVEGVRAEVVTEVPADASAVLLLDGMREVTSAEDAIEITRRTFDVLGTISARLERAGGLVVLVQDTGGSFGVHGAHPRRAWLGGIAGLARTAALEWPMAVVRGLDCERGDTDTDTDTDAADAARRIVDELLTGASTSDVGLRADGTRTTLVVERIPATEATSSPVNGSSLIVATGGARGVTARCLVALAERHRPKIVLFGRTSPTEPADPADMSPVRAIRAARAAQETRDAITTLRRLGAQVRHFAIDVRDEEAIAAALAQVRTEWGPVTGIVHGAGVIADKLISAKSPEQFRTVFDTKVRGLRALLAATSEDPLEFVCLFSSISSVTGNPGQSDYAAANETMNVVASSLLIARPECDVRSIAWGPWEGGMVDPGIAARFEARGVPLIRLPDGARTFLDLLGGAADERVIVTAGETVRLGVPEISVTGEIQLGIDVDDHLADHRIAGSVVVPIAVMVDWFLRLARAHAPTAVADVITGLTVARKVVVDDGGCPIRLLVGARPDDGVLDAVLRGADGTHHVHASIEASTSRFARSVRAPVDLPGRAPDAVVYDGDVLFHGPRFQAITSVDGLSSAGAEARLRSCAELGWPPENRGIDPLLVDGAMQLAALWAAEVLGGPSLPMGFAQCRVNRSAIVHPSARCALRAVGTDDRVAECDLVLLGPEGEFIAEILGVRMVLRPS